MPRSMVKTVFPEDPFVSKEKHFLQCLCARRCGIDLNYDRDDDRRELFHNVLQAIATVSGATAADKSANCAALAAAGEVLLTGQPLSATGVGVTGADRLQLLDLSDNNITCRCYCCC